MKFLLTGKDGQVGFELQRALAPLGEIVAVDQTDCDLSKPEEIRQLIASVGPDVIVNPAAYTAVDKAESDVDKAHAVNAVAPGVIGEEAKKCGAVVVHYSTDYVFDGLKDGAYSEIDATNPQSVYGKSKLAGEQALQASGADHLIFRTSWVFGAHGANFAKTMLRLAGERDELNIVADQYGAPTSAALLADVTAQLLAQLIRNGKFNYPFGLYHLVASGVTTWHAYAQAVVSAASTRGKTLRISAANIKPIPSSAYPVPAPRPLNSRLNTEKLQTTFGIRLQPWEEGLDHVLQQII
jgi:dTDP-4-dehydrorhamnose reductase